jgi:hypothetical protein
MNIKEIGLEYNNDLEALRNDLQKLDFINIKDNQCQIQINDNFFAFLFINLPDKLKADQILNKFKIDKVERIYKDRLCWHLVTNDKDTSDIIFEYINNVNKI